MKLQEKKDVTKQLTESVSSANAIVLTDYQGLKAEKVRELRRLLQTTNATFQIVKNTLLTRALKTANVLKNSGSISVEGPTGVILTKSQEPSDALKALLGFIKDNSLPTLKAGVFEGLVLSTDKIEMLARLPSRTQLLGQFAGSLLTPLHRLAFAIQNPRQKLVFVLSEIPKIKGGEH